MASDGLHDSKKVLACVSRGEEDEQRYVEKRVEIRS